MIPDMASGATNAPTTTRHRFLLVAILLAVPCAQAARADEPAVNLALNGAADSAPESVPDSGVQDIGTYVANWFQRVNDTQAAQPFWAAPLTTVTPLLKEFAQYSQSYERLPNGSSVTNYDGGAPGVGVHIIPDAFNEVFIGTPTYATLAGKKTAAGLTDFPFLLVKTRLATGNEQNGDYVVTAYLSGQSPVGIKPFSANAYYVTPTIAGGKGWGDFDIQANIGTPMPTSNLQTLGAQLSSNVALQYHLLKYLWPEFELNDTYWLNGVRGGLNQLFLTPDVILGPYPLDDTRLAASLLVGYQFAATPNPILNPLTPLYNHSVIFAARLFF